MKYTNSIPSDSQPRENGPTPLSFFSVPSRYLQNNPYIPLRVALASELLQGIEFRTILDVGSGDGTVSRAIATRDAHVVLLDFSQPMLEIALMSFPVENRSRVQAVHGDLTSFETSESFDLVLCLGVLAHLQDWKLALRRVAGWIRPDGHLLLQFTDSAALGSGLSWLAVNGKSALGMGRVHQLARMSFDQVEQAALGAGLTLVAARRHWFVPGLRWVPSRWTGRLLHLLTSETPVGHGGEIVALFRAGNRE